jgi:hypothetical protein
LEGRVTQLVVEYVVLGVKSNEDIGHLSREIVSDIFKDDALCKKFNTSALDKIGTEVMSITRSSTRHEDDIEGG